MKERRQDGKQKDEERSEEEKGEQAADSDALEDVKDRIMRSLVKKSKTRSILQTRADNRACVMSKA